MDYLQQDGTRYEDYHDKQADQIEKALRQVADQYKEATGHDILIGFSMVSDDQSLFADHYCSSQTKELYTDMCAMLAKSMFVNCI